MILTLTECLPCCCLTSSRARRETSSPVMMRVRKAQVRRAGGLVETLEPRIARYVMSKL